jgi:hypothetical protein
MVDAFETRARKLLDHRTDDGVYFEHLGADFLMVDNQQVPVTAIEPLNCSNASSR